MPPVPAIRVRAFNDRPVREDGEYVVYWMTAFRRLDFNFALQHAVDRARALGRPLLILEALRCGYPWASDRLHRFVLDGMREHRQRLADTRVAYHPYVEPEAGAGRGLLAALAMRACLVVGDDYPAFFLPRMLAAAAHRLPVRLDAVDGNGLLPMAAAETTFPTAHAFRRFLQKSLPEHLGDFPTEHPLAGAPLPGPAAFPEDVLRRWPAASDALLAGDADALAELPIDHDVEPAPDRGGTAPAREALATFLDERLLRYHTDRNAPEEEVASGLSPWLHFGHIGVHELFRRLTEQEGWTPGDLSDDTAGKRAGWWGMSEPAEAFLDELITWREVGFNMCRHRADHDRYASLPGWARQTLEEHADDPRPHLYTLRQFERAATHDELWNAAQRQLVREGRIHNYLRMLWGKKILEWTPSPRQALKVMIELNNKYALDGRDPNSYSGIFWVLGRYDRPWGPERPVFGKIRYMTSANTARKVPVKGYIRRFGAGRLDFGG